MSTSLAASLLKAVPSPATPIRIPIPKSAVSHKLNVVRAVPRPARPAPCHTTERAGSSTLDVVCVVPYIPLDVVYRGGSRVRVEYLNEPDCGTNSRVHVLKRNARHIRTYTCVH